MARLFGTDGVRGIANTELDCKLAYRLGQAAVAFMGNTIVVGKDTRKSGDMLESALVAGITSAGGNAVVAGVVPTPAIALMTNSLPVAGGVVISASHNPPEYNGIKFFDGNGFKLPDAREDEIEEFIKNGGFEGTVEAVRAQGEEASMPVGDMVGQVIQDYDLVDMYVEHIIANVRDQGIDFAGMRIALDTAHGASSYTSAEVLRQLGAEVIQINDEYDGNDINVNCGSTHLEPLHALMEETGADVGIAHDGDADRVMLISPDGTEIDGDMVEAVMALDLKAQGLLEGNTAVTTIDTNMGFVAAMKAAGINVVQTNVGDRYVLENMRQNGYVLGGERSGHMILLKYNTTGDGLMTACQFLCAVKRSGKTVDEAIKVMSKYPKVTRNVRVADKHAFAGNTAIAEAVAKGEAEIGDKGRVIVRPSGTEPVIRVTVEAEDEAMVEPVVAAIAAVVEEQLG